MMNEKIKTYCGFFIVAIAVFLIIAVLAGIKLYGKSIAQNRTFAVSGEGRVAVTPDVAVLTFGLLTEGGKDLAKLTKDNNDKIELIIKALKENGIQEKDIVTELYNIAPRYQYFTCPSGAAASPCPPAEIVGYSVTQNVTVKIRNINNAGGIVGIVVARGANTVSSLAFTVDDPGALQNQAREIAIAKAQETAGLMAAAGGFRVRKIISIEEGVSSAQPAAITGAYGLGGAGGGVPVQPGTQNIIANVKIIYEIR